MKNNIDKKEPRKDLYAINLGYTMVVGIALFAFLGHWMDAKFNSGYRWTLGGMLLGFATGIYEVWKITQRLNRSEVELKKD